MNIPLVSDPKRTIAQDYGVLKSDEGISFRYILLEWWSGAFIKRLTSLLESLFFFGESLEP
jgi:hypothetical protein